MRVGPQITEYLVGTAERWFAVDHPAVTEKLAEKTAEGVGLRQGSELSAELKLSRGEGLFQGFGKLATEDLAENCLGDEEVAAPGANPVCVIGR